MSSIDDRGRRAGADLRRAASHSDGPPLDELVSRQRGLPRRAVAAGLAVALIAGIAWSGLGPNGGADSTDVLSTGTTEVGLADAGGPSDELRSDPDGNGADDRSTGATDDGAPGGTAEGSGAGSGSSTDGVGPSGPASTTVGAPSAAGSGNGGPRSSDPSSPATSDPTSPGATTPDPATPGGATPDPTTPGGAAPLPTSPPSTTAPPATSPPPTSPPTTPPPPVGPPSGPLTPSSPAWTSTCATADSLLALAWAVHSGSSSDIVGVALLFIDMVGKVPAGTAPAEVAYTAALLDAMQGGHGVAPFAADFTGNANTLVLAIGAGCGVPGGLPLPPSTIPQIYTLVFELGLF